MTISQDAVREVGERNWTRRASMVTVRSWMKNRRQGSDPQCLSPEKGTRTQKRKVVEAIVETSKALTVTERRVRSDVSELHQEEVRKPEERASAVTETAEFPETASTTADSPRGELRSMCARMTTRRKLRSSVETLSGRKRCSGM